MNLPDVNIWIALTFSKHVFHPHAAKWFAAQPGNPSVFFCRMTQLSYLRLLTTEGIMKPYDLAPMSNRQAWEQLESLLARPQVAFAKEPADTHKHWKAWAALASAFPKRWMDAYLAAFAFSAGMNLVTTDRAFTQYKGLSTVLLPQAAPRRR